MITITPHFGQLLFVKQTLYYKTQNVSEVCWGARCRFGKSVCCYLLSDTHYELDGNVNMLIVCERPSETKQSFSNYYKGDKKYNLQVINSAKDESTLDFSVNNIVIISDQLLKQNSDSILLDTLSSIKWDYIIKDEDHVGGCTDKSNEVESKLVSPTTMVIPMTATFNKSKYMRNSQIVLTWSVHDDTNLANNLFKNLHGDRFSKSIMIDTLTEMKYKYLTLKPDIVEHYKHVPKLHYMTLNWDPEYYASICKLINPTGEGFTIDHLWELDGKKQFVNETSIISLVDYIGGKRINKDPKYIYTRINMHSKEYGSGDVNIGVKPCTHLWFLPSKKIHVI